MQRDEDYQRMAWASRRGLLELDLLLNPFMAERYSTLTAELKDDYRRLMACEDQEILNWILAREAPGDESLNLITASIREHNRGKLR
jgi:antitoxin CptB